MGYPPDRELFFVFKNFLPIITTIVKHKCELFLNITKILSFFSHFFEKICSDFDPHVKM